MKILILLLLSGCGTGYLTPEGNPGYWPSDCGPEEMTDMCLEEFNDNYCQDNPGDYVCEGE